MKKMTISPFFIPISKKMIIFAASISINRKPKQIITRKGGENNNYTKKHTS
jgi:hypothetical protein